MADLHTPAIRYVGCSGKAEDKQVGQELTGIGAPQDHAL